MVDAIEQTIEGKELSESQKNAIREPGENICVNAGAGSGKTLTILHGFYIDSETSEIKGLEGYDGKKITLNKKHNIEKSFLKYHLEDYKKNN